MSWDEVGEMPCSVARSLAIVGDRWTLLILRNVFLRVRRFADLQTQLGIPRHVLSTRLKRLVEEDVLAKVAYQESPPRYEYKLTEKGKDLYPVILSLVAWGDKWLDQGKGPPLLYRHKQCGHTFRPTLACSECGEPITARDVAVEMGPGMLGE